MWVLSIPAAVQEDFLQFGWDALTAQLPEREGMRDAWNAVEFATPKGTGKHMTVRLHPALGPLLRTMLEIRWADHMYAMHDELELAYSRVTDDLKNRTASEARKGRRK